MRGEPLLVGDGEVAAFVDDEAVVLEARQRPRDDLADRADAGGDLLVGVREGEAEAAAVARALRARLGEQEAREALADLA